MSQSNVTNNQKTVWLIFIIGLIPVVMAFGAYFLKIGIPNSTSNHGVLIKKGQKLEDLIPSVAQEMDDQHFHLISFSKECNSGCIEYLQELKNIHWGIGRFTPKVRRWHVSEHVSIDEVKQMLPDQRVKLAKVPTNLDSLLGTTSWTDDWVLLVDPYGYLVMAFNPKIHGKGMIDDLKKLVRMSELG